MIKICGTEKFNEPNGNQFWWNLKNIVLRWNQLSFFFYHENGTKNVSFKNMQVEKNFDSFVLPCEIWTVALFKKKKEEKKRKIKRYNYKIINIR